MMEKVTLQLHSFILDLLTGPAGSRDFWRWKTDPFRISGETGAVADARIHLYHRAVNELPDLKRMDLIDSRKTGFYTYNTYAGPDGSIFWLMDRTAKKQRILSFRINGAWNEIRLMDDYSETGGQLAYEILSRILPGVLLKKNIMQIHAVLMEDSGRGILFCADSGVGKTTHARLWRDYRKSIIIDGDRATCVKEGNEWIAFGIPWCGTSGEYMNRSVPIKAVVILDQGESNEVSRFEGTEAFFGVLPHLQYPAWDRELMSRGMDLLQKLTEDIPVFHLVCRPDVQAIEILEAELWEL